MDGLRAGCRATLDTGVAEPQAVANLLSEIAAELERKCQLTTDMARFLQA